MYFKTSLVKKAGSAVTRSLMAISLSLLPAAAFAQGLDQADQAMDDFRVWAYGALAIGCLIYMLYQVSMALLQKQPWADVLMGLVYCAIAGGIMVAADFAWSIWGTGGAL